MFRYYNQRQWTTVRNKGKLHFLMRECAKGACFGAAMVIARWLWRGTPDVIGDTIDSSLAGASTFLFISYIFWLRIEARFEDLQP
jgi:hypothetical protein